MQQSTIYDSVFKTTIHDSRRMILPAINALYQEGYRGDEELVHLQDEHYINTPEEIKELDTDSYFMIKGKPEKRYHFECQSTPDSTMLLRMYQYDSQVAFGDNTLEAGKLTVRYPLSAVLFLRHTRNTPDTMHIYVETSQGRVLQEVRVMKLKNYALGEIFEKRLFLLIPFYILVHENRFKVCDEDEMEREKIIKEYKRIAVYLEEMVKSGELNEYERNLLASMVLKVVEHCLEKYEVIKKGIEAIMGGVLLDYPAKTILNTGRAEGRAEGRKEMVRNLMQSMGITAEKACELLKLNMDDYKSAQETLLLP